MPPESPSVQQPAQNNPLPGKDFTIKTAVPAGSNSSQDQLSLSGVPPSVPNSGAPLLTLSADTAIIGAAIVLGLTIIWLFVRSALRSHLISHRASPSEASNAGWALFAFLSCVSITIVFGFVGQLWQVLIFVIPLGAIILLTLVLFIVLYNSAAKAGH